MTSRTYDSVVPAAAAGVCALAAKVALSIPQAEGQEAVVAVTWLVVASYVAVGIALLNAGLPRVNGWLCILVALATIPGDLNDSAFATSYLTPVGYILEPLYLPVTAALVLCYPRDRLSDGERRLVVSLAIAAVVTRVLTIFTVGPLPDGFRSPTTWSTIPAPPWIHDVLSIRVGRFIVMTLLLLACVLIARRPLKASGLARRSLTPLAVIVVLCALAAVADQAMWALDLTSLHWPVPSLARNLTAAAIPVALLVDLLRRRAAAAAITEKVLASASSGNAAALQTALRDVLADPSVTVATHDTSGWCAADGARVTPTQGHQRLSIVSRQDGTPLVAVAVDASGELDEGLLQTALIAVRVGAENSQLQADLVARMAELQESRTRIVEAGLSERRRVERDLHDGAQQRFLAVAATLARSDVVDDTQLREIVGDARAGLASALRELRELARGIHPAILSQGGLPAALLSLTSRGLNEVDLQIDQELGQDRPSPAHESAIYFFVAESLTNAVRHAQAHRITVDVRRIGPNIHAVVADDGSGQACLVDGGGLAGLRDRLEALGGTFTVHCDPCSDHPEASGTTLATVVAHTVAP